MNKEDYDAKKKKALNRVAETLEECLDMFPEQERDQAREDIANYTIGYLGVSFGLHVRR